MDKMESACRSVQLFFVKYKIWGGFYGPGEREACLNLVESNKDSGEVGCLFEHELSPCETHFRPHTIAISPYRRSLGGAYGSHDRIL